MRRDQLEHANTAGPRSCVLRRLLDRIIVGLADVPASDNVAQRCPQDGRIIAVAQRSAEGFIERDSMRGEVSRRPVFEIRFAVDREIRDLCIRRLFC